MGYEVSTAVFEGPFDLLLHLITSDEVDVYEISISTIVDAYVGELEKMTGNLDLATATEFALIAATLIQLKCRRLLPVSGEIDLDEELAMWEERDLLLSKLLEFSAFKDVAAMVRDQMEVAAKSLPRVSGMEEEFFDVVPDLLEGLSPNKLRNAMLKLLTPKVEPQLTLEHVTQAAVSVADTVRMIAERLATEGTATF
ncbi:MAG TPA: segregation/condensation protein A, partial [Acidimicrobiales bacterium]|nr:segregation/condensation protein A [Acidimicrobiales bacterium]